MNKLTEPCPSCPWAINLFVSAALSVTGCLSGRNICSRGAILLPPCWAITQSMEIFTWQFPGERPVNLRYRTDREVLMHRPTPQHEDAQRAGVDADWACRLFVSPEWKMVGWVGRATDYKGISKLKPRRLSFPPFELASICHDEGPGTVPSTAHPHPTPPPVHLSNPIKPPNLRSPLVSLQRIPIFVLQGAAALVLAGVRPLLPILSQHITRTEMIVNKAVGSLFSNF